MLTLLDRFRDPKANAQGIAVTVASKRYRRPQVITNPKNEI